MSTNLKSPPECLRNTKCKKGTLPVRPPILYVPPADLHEKQETEQIKVKLLNRTKFQMSTYGTGNSKEYLVHVFAILGLVEQKRTAAKVKEAFAAFIAVRKEMSHFFFDSLMTRLQPRKKQEKRSKARKKKLNNLKDKEALKAKKDIGVAEAQKAYELFRCFVVGEARMQWDRIVNEMHTKNQWIGVNGKANKGICVRSWISFMDCIELHKLTIFPADTAKKQHYYMQQMIKKPQRVMVHQFMSCMGVLNDYLAYLPTVFDTLMAVSDTKKIEWTIQ
jgi:hypothetical protein